MANPKCIVQVIIFFTMVVADSRAMSFNFSSFTPNMEEIVYWGDAYTSQGAIQLTKNERNESLKGSVGRVVYGNPIRLAENFTTHFTFLITTVSDDAVGDGIAFFMAANGARLNLTSTGGWLGLTDWASDGNSSNQIVAVEFDTFSDSWDPPSDHIGVDVNSNVSVTNKTFPGQSGLRRGDKADAWVDYQAGRLSVFLSYDGLREETADLCYDIDLREVLPEWVNVGFAASTGDSTEVHKLLSWEFSISEPGEGMGIRYRRLVLAVAIVFPVLAIVGLVCGILYGKWYRTYWQGDLDVEIDGWVVHGPRRFRYKELCLATRGFADKLGQGGFGGVYQGILPGTKVAVAVKRVSRGSWQLFKVYHFDEGEIIERSGLKWSTSQLCKSNQPCEFYHFEEGQNSREEWIKVVDESTHNVPAMQKKSTPRPPLFEDNLFAHRSTYGKKEYISEISIISRLRHRNLVRLLGWCHEGTELLLVYEHMSNRSLDQHLYGQTLLKWAVRYKIICGLARALLYLHEECEQCIVHRDVKSSNVMLDADFNAKLGDFGFARLVEHGGRENNSIVFAGTVGYLAPECLMTGRASAETDVFSFGAVALEIVCGRRPISDDNDILVQWVWSLHGRGRLLEALDGRLVGDYNEEEIEVVLKVGLWCSHPDPATRPTMREVVRCLRFEAPIPRLPSKLPLPVYSPLSSPCRGRDR